MNKIGLPYSQIQIIHKTLDFIKSVLVDKIELEYARIAAANVIEKLKQTATVLADTNPDNREQLKTIWGNFLSEPAIAESVRLALFDAIAKIEDKDVKDGLTILIDPLVATLVALSDVNTSDGEQLEKIWIDFVKSKNFLDYAERFLEPFLKKIIKNDFAVDLILGLLKMFVK